MFLYILIYWSPRRERGSQLYEVFSSQNLNLSGFPILNRRKEMIKKKSHQVEHISKWGVLRVIHDHLSIWNLLNYISFQKYLKHGFLCLLSVKRQEKKSKKKESRAAKFNQRHFVHLWQALNKPGPSEVVPSWCSVSIKATPQVRKFLFGKKLRLLDDLFEM